MRPFVFAFVALGACGFALAPGHVDDAGVDDAGVDQTLRDAPQCVASLATCADALTLRCTAGGMTVDTPCEWGCITASPAHCGTLFPAGGGVTPGDLSPTGLGAVELTGTIDADTGAISGIRGAGIGIVDGIGYTLQNGVAVFRFEGVHVAGGVSITGGVAVAFVAASSIGVDAVIDVRGPCGDGAGRIPGPGGNAGGASAMTASGSGGGEGNNSNDDGGGGGGYGGPGGVGGGNQAGGSPFGDAAVTMLVGGGGGGGGKNNTAGGGGGGGAIQLVSNTTIAIGASGGINAGGCGGSQSNGGPNDAGGGGGAGGTVLLEAPSVTIAGSIAVNGGGGGGRMAGTNGAGGRLDRTAAAGGGMGGGAGAAGPILAGTAANLYGGGGGGVGRIRVHTRTGAANVSGSTMSPSFTDATTATEGIADIR